jgi:site-specific DNA-methyltransferase (adenine-specific)
MDLNKIYTGHALDILKQFSNSFINMCVTSPPYWGLRDYNTEPVKWNDGWTGELGAESDFNQYITHLCDIFDEVKRVLKDDGTCWVNLGDTYGGSSLNLSYSVKTKGETSFLKDVNHLQKTAHTRGKFSKSLLLIPFRFAIEMMNRGWTVRNVIIWQKPNASPSSAKDRFTVDFEYLFLFSKNKKYYFKQQLEPFKKSTIARCKTGCVINKGSQYKGLNKENFEKLQQRILSGAIQGKNKRTVWQISNKGYHGAHFATFPKDLVEIPIKAGCPENGIVLDPFIGSGTTAIVAEKLNCNWIGIELNPQYTQLANERIEQER